MSDAGAAQAESGTAQLISAEDYAKQIRDKIAVGRTVRCRRCYRKVHETDIGTVTKLDKDGLHDLNVQVHWHKAGGASWVRYVHVELLEDSGVRLGEQVRVRRSVVRPKYGWGSVNHDSVGKVTGLSSDGDVIVHFPEKRGWKALMSELEPATAERREEAVRKKIGVGDQVRVKRSVDEPRFKWGNVTHNSVGKVTDISNRPEGQVVTIDFPEYPGWKGLLSEMELATGERREEAVRKKIVVGDKVRVKRSVEKPRYEWGNVSHGSIGKVTSEDQLLLRRTGRATQ